MAENIPYLQALTLGRIIKMTLYYELCSILVMTIMQQLSTRGATAEQGPVVSAVRPPACGAVQNTLRNLCKYFAQAAWPHCTYSIVTLAKVTSEC